MKVKCLICGAVFEDTYDNCPVCGVGREYYSLIEDTSINNNDSLTVLIIGGGIAAYKVINELSNVKNIKIKLIYDEFILPYQKPLLSKKLFSLDNNIILEDENYYKKNNVTLINDYAISINEHERYVKTLKNEKIFYDKLIVATGATPFIPPIKGNMQKGIFTLRNILDAKKIVEYSTNKDKILIIGGGILGLETAISLKNNNKDVYIFEANNRLIPNSLDDYGSNYLLKKLIEKGINIKLNVKINEIKNELNVIYNDNLNMKFDQIIFSTGIVKNNFIIENIDFNYKYLCNDKRDIFLIGDILSKYGTLSEIDEMLKVLVNNMFNSDLIKYEEKNTYLMTKLDDISILSLGNKTLDYMEVQNNDNYAKYYFNNNILDGLIFIGKNKIDDFLNLYLKKYDKNQIKELINREN